MPTKYFIALYKCSQKYEEWYGGCILNTPIQQDWTGELSNKFSELTKLFVKTSGSVLRLKTKVDKCGLFQYLWNCLTSVLMSRSHFPTPKISHLSTDDFNFIYEPAEDTFLMLDALEKDCGRIEKLRYTL